MSHERHGVSNHKLLDYFFNRLFSETTPKIPKLHNTGPLWGKSIGTGWIPLTKAINVVSVSVPRRHHVLTCLGYTWTIFTKGWSRVSSMCGSCSQFQGPESNEIAHCTDSNYVCNICGCHLNLCPLYWTKFTARSRIEPWCTITRIHGQLRASNHALRVTQNGCHDGDDISKTKLSYENGRILIKMSLIFALDGAMNKWTLALAR